MARDLGQPPLHQRVRAGDEPAQVRRVDLASAECENDLAALVRWGNLLPEQDRTRARTPEEFKRRRYVYHVRERTIALDRLTRALDRDEAGRGTLDTSLLERLWARLDGLRHTLESALAAEPDEAFLRQQVWGPWGDAFRLFEQPRTGANDFHHSLRAARPEDLNRADEFCCSRTSCCGTLTGSSCN